jgi:hypothetical protein
LNRERGKKNLQVQAQVTSASSCPVLNSPYGSLKIKRRELDQPKPIPKSNKRKTSNAEDGL